MAINSKSENFSQLQNGLTQYIGGMLINAKSNNTAAHEVEAVLCEAIISLSRKDDGSINMFAVKPIIRAMQYIIQQRSKEMEKSLATLPKNLKDQVLNEQKQILGYLKNILDNTEEKDNG